jgi:hypothetical protein
LLHAPYALLHAIFLFIEVSEMRLRLLACCLLAAMGCSAESTGPKEYPVSGTVTFDGKPVESGRILFRKIGDGDRAYGGEITNGAYSFTSEAGKVKVEITASRLIPGKFDNSNGTPEPVGEMYIPKQYNSKSTLEAEVKADGENTLPFELVSK